MIGGEPASRRPGATTPVTPVVIGADGSRRPRSDVVATEEPLEIRVAHRGREHQVAVTMRTPGHDFELAAGFLLGEGMVRERRHVGKVTYCASGPPEQLYNLVTVELANAAPFDADAMRRNMFTSSSCGVCGKASIEAVRSGVPVTLPAGPVVDAATLLSLPDTLRTKQKVFERTGGLHAAGLFDAQGTPLLVREDVGRHNAVDKVAGALLLAGGIPAGERILQVSGRASFEIVQKAAMAGIPIVAAVSAPSSLAVELADETGMTLIGFSRESTLGVYTRPERIA
ncbi:MAG TPA: formate dehydrogenase accessory sulfurtransferase FdhD [Actinomycetota bacterium]|nr:formate dehydrogenase accessory sulfurtransferase FdhD [Actinomycetota bacterium]